MYESGGDGGRGQGLPADTCNELLLEKLALPKTVILIRAIVLKT